MMNKTAIQELKTALLDVCSKNKILKDISNENIEKIINALAEQQFVRDIDDGEESRKLIDKTLEKIYEEMVE